MAGKYQRYTEVKLSGIPWVLDELPSHWHVLPAFSVLKDEQIKNAGGKETHVLSLSYGNIKTRDVERNAGLLPESFHTYQRVWPGDIILRLTDLQNDKRSLRVGRSSLKGIITSAYLKLKAAKDLDDRYLYRLLHSYDTSKVFYGMGGGLRQSLKFEDFRRLPIIVPPVDEQEAIANFLDHETAKIDALIEKQEKLIELLKEKRQAVISHAVTKGLNPDVPMKHSGIEWLGEVPEHWRIVKFSYVTTIQSGQVDPKESPYDQFDLIAPNHIESGTGKLLALETAQAQGADSGKYLCPVGCVIYSKIRPALAKVTLSPHENVICSADMYPIIGSRNLYNIFLKWTLLSDWFTSLTILESDRVAMPKINREKLADVKIVVPSLDEQMQIASYLDGVTTKLDVSIAKGQEQIQLLKERKSSLISSAVTGKIDVRNWQSRSKEADHA